MNVIQVVMLFIAGGFILSIYGIDQMLKEHKIPSAVRKKVSTILFLLAIIVEVLLVIILWKST